MNNFKQGLKVEKVKKQDNFREKINIAVRESIANIETSDQDEEIQKIEYMINLKKIMDNYEQLRPILTEYFYSEKWIDR